MIGKKVWDTISPKQGAKHVAPRAKEIRERMVEAASIALLDIELNEKEAIQKLKETSGKAKGKIKKELKNMMEMPDIKMIRKHWHDKPENSFLHFIGDQTKVSAG